MNDVYIQDIIKHMTYIAPKKYIQKHMPQKTFQIEHIYLVQKNSIVHIFELTIIQHMVSIFLFNGEFKQLSYLSIK